MFVGRDQELAELQSALKVQRLITLTGTAGVGKSRLARQVVERERAASGDESCWADLWQLADERMLAALVADACGLSDHTPRMPLDVIAQWIGERELLIVLDSCEHVLPACRRLVETLLAECPHLTILATSREVFHLDGEHVVVVEPLPCATDAAELFLQRAEQMGAVPPPGELNQVTELCTYLDGLPLALELAAGALRHSSIAELLHRPRHALHREETDPVRIPTPRRHEVLRTALGWSHELCTPKERLLWARLSIVLGHVDAPMAAALCAGGPLTARDVEDALAGLVDKSVVTRRGERYLLLDTVREYGRLWLTQLGELDSMATAHAAHFLALARQADATWTSAEQSGWYRTIKEAHPDLCAALDYLLDHHVDDAVELATLTGFYWTCCGHAHTAQQYLARALQAGDSGQQAATRQRAVWALGLTHLLQGNHAVGTQLARQCLALARGDQDPSGLLRAAYLQAMSDLLQGNADQALDLLEGALQATHDEDGAAAPAGHAVMMCRMLRLFALTGVGRLEESQEAATALRTECVAMGEHWIRSYTDYQLCVIALREQHGEAALEHARSMLTSKQQIGDTFGIALGLDMLAASYSASGDGRSAALASGGGQRLWEAVGHPQRGAPDVQPLREFGENTARELVGAGAYDTYHSQAAHTDPAAVLAWAAGGEAPL
ncbi:putative HTH-type transcriptional regulator [Streptomyces sp. YIM 130001]|uniref:ATP-binding protein n=1 Tax=Streptomyces sp. YIM 130001 TaxID=2259644 RepID=UPI000EEE0AD9|nr:AAA family ATPase [Streptomyces sp. YIM 130001]RII17743.1 putative HTH-type transcriptional regulator [Streptomyces sp. YIM 130001]